MIGGGWSWGHARLVSRILHPQVGGGFQLIARAGLAEECQAPSRVGGKERFKQRLGAYNKRRARTDFARATWLPLHLQPRGWSRSGARKPKTDSTQR